MGASTRFEITTLAKNSATGRFTERPFGEGNLPTGTTDILERMPNLTTAIHRDNGIGGVSTTRYAYQGNGIDDAGERGFLGFFAQRIIDEQSGNITYLKKRLDFPLVGKVAESLTYNANQLVSKQENHYTNRSTMHGTGGVTHFPYLINNTTYQYEAGTLTRATQRRHRSNNGC